MAPPKKPVAKPKPVEGILDGLWDKLELLKIFALLRDIDIKEIMDIPSTIKDGEAVCKWVRAVLNALEVGAKMTPISADDEAILVLQAALRDNETWAAFHSMLISQFLAEEHILVGNSDGLEAAKVTAVAEAFGKKVGIDPASIIAIVTAIIQLIKWWRARK